MTFGQVITDGLGILVLVPLVIAFVRLDKKPELLSPIWKLSVSLILIAFGFATPFVIPGVLTGLSPASPLVVALLCPLFVVPQSFIGAGTICALLLLRLDGQAARDANHIWWIVSLLGMLWSTICVLSLGVAFAGW